MADTTTTNYAWVKPEVGGSNDTWGDKLNADLDALDAKIKAVSDTVDGYTAAGPLTLASFSANNSILAKDSTGALAVVTLAEGTILGRRAGAEVAAIDYAALKADLALNNVDNYSRAQLKTYFDSIYEPAGSGGGGITGEPHTAILTEISTVDIAAGQIWVGTGPSTLAQYPISDYMRGLLTAADQTTFNATVGSLAIDTQSLVPSNGYVKLANGLMLQWGVVTVGGSSDLNVTFGQPYTSFAICVGSGGYDDPGLNDAGKVTQVSTTGFKVCNHGHGTQFWWLSVGK